MDKKKITGFYDTLKSKRITTVAGAWVFYFLTALLPLVFLLITAFSVFGVSLRTEVVGRLPEEFRLAGETVLSTAENASKGITVFFIITVLFSGSALLNQMSKDGDYLYGVKSKTRHGLLRRLWAIFGVCALFALFLGIAFLFTFRNLLFARFSFEGNNRIFITISAFLFIFLFGYVIILLLNKFISPVKLKFTTELAGGFTALAIIALGTIAFMLYLRFFNSYNAFYGSLAAIIIFLLWAYILMLGLVLGVTVNMELYRKSKIKEKRKNYAGN